MLTVHAFTFNPVQENTYIVYNAEKQCCIIDPGCYFASEEAALKRFISDNPFESEAGGDLASSARKSVSKLLSEQLNRLSSNVKGVELSFDLKSYDDYSQGSAQAQTELELGVQKSLLNDRLIVKVSGNVNVEGETNKQSSLTDYIGDVALEYKLTADGRLRVTGFRNSNYDIIDGELIETGAGVIYIKDYDSFLELFKPNAKKK